MQFKLEYLYYLPTIYRNETFAYVKLASGNAQYESNKLSILGEDRDFKVGPVDYTGGGIGMGRRWNLNHFCIVFNGGLKYVALPQNLSDENRKHFDLFYGTGPGSIIDLNFKIGYQF
ncbi:MAG: hypothetical protein EBZ77_10875 [Chitinophagia bacterium]|nr:hypothetical protein [Chitinophagia bacterium]